VLSEAPAEAGWGFSWSRLPGTDRIAVRPELSGFRLTGGPAEGIHDGAVLNFDQTRAFDDRRPPCARQGPGDSARPEVDVAQGRFRHGSLHADVGDLGPPSGVEGASDLPYAPSLFGTRLITPFEMTGPPNPSRLAAARRGPDGTPRW
jgi:hypothetical protein